MQTLELWEHKTNNFSNRFKIALFGKALSFLPMTEWMHGNYIEKNIKFE